MAVLLAAAMPPGWQAGPAPDRTAATWVEQTLSRMTLDEKIGQLLVTSLNASFTSTDSDTFEKLRHLVRDTKVGGVHVFGGVEAFPALMLNPTYGSGGTARKGDPYAAAAMLNRLQREAQVPILTTADFEGGVGYMLAAVGPLLVGLIHSLTESYASTAILFVLLGLGVAVFGWGAGRALHVKARTITL